MLAGQVLLKADPKNIEGKKNLDWLKVDSVSGLQA